MTTAAAPTLDRAFITTPGQSLLQPQSPFALGARLQEFCDATGLTATDVVLTPLCAIPLPRYQADTVGQNRRWAGIRADAMWHPLFWLPSQIAGRRIVVEDETDTGWVEDDDTWAVRVATELTWSGLYNESTGTWADVLALHGLNIADPGTITRLNAWLDGQPDQVLDAINMSEYLIYPDDPGWSTALACENLPNLQVTGWFVAADALLESVDGLDLDMFESNPAGLHASLRTAAMLCDVSFDTIPGWQAGVFLATIDTWNGQVDDLTERLQPWLSDQLDEIRRVYEEALEAIAHPEPAPGDTTSGLVDPFA